MRDQDEAAVELRQVVLEHLERRDVEIVRRLVEHQEIGRLTHELGDQDSRLLAARESADRHLELLGAEQESLGPRRHVHVPALPHDGVAVRSERAAQRLRGIESATVLPEARDTKTVSALDDAVVRRDRAREYLDQRRLAAAVRTDEANSRATRDDEVEVVEQRAAPERLCESARDEKSLRLPRRRGELDARGPPDAALTRIRQLLLQAIRFLDSSAGLGRSCLRALAQPLDLAPHGIGERLLVGGLPSEELVAAGEKLAV